MTYEKHITKQRFQLREHFVFMTNLSCLFVCLFVFLNASYLAVTVYSYNIVHRFDVVRDIITIIGINIFSSLSLENN